MDQDFDFPSTPATKRRVSKESPKPASFKSGPSPESKDVATVDTADVAQPPAKQYSEEELSAIFDEIIFSGEYSEEVNIRGKLRVSFRTRTAEEIRQITQAVDGTQAVYANTIESIRSLLQLQYALTAYQGKDLAGLRLEDKAKFIGQIPGPVVALLLQALSKFDQKVYEACQEGEANF
jgi:hypothetical protein